MATPWEHDTHTIHAACRAATPVSTDSDVAVLQAAICYHLRFRMAMPYAIYTCAFQALLPPHTVIVTLFCNAL